MSLDLGIEIEYDGTFYTKTAVENLNKLFSKIKEQNKFKKQYIILLDEIYIGNDGMDFSDLHLIFPFINILMAINPAAYNMTIPVNITSPSGNNILAKQLFTKHRNSFQIAVLLAHINKFYKDKDGQYKCLDVANDKPLEASNIPTGPLPIWIQRSQDATDEEVLEYMKESFLKEAIGVTLVHSSRKQFSQEAKSWLDQEEWKVLIFRDMTGSETDNLVAFIEDTTANMEVFSRAKKLLIIVTK